MGRRGSRLGDRRDFIGGLREAAPELHALSGLHIEDPTLDVETLVSHVSGLVSSMGIVANKARIVAATKTLHHLLPDLVPPMDRAWTGAFFGWTTQDPQNDQARTFCESYRRFIRVAQEVRPSRLVGLGWRTSATKLLDNAVIGYCLEHQLGPAAS